MNLNITGKCALVTAASQGLGLACAQALANEGAKVAICSRNEMKIMKIAKEISLSSNSEVIGIACDLSNIDDINRLLNKIYELLGNIDILVFNHGNLTPGSFDKVTLDTWQQNLSISLLPAIHLMNTILPKMKEQLWGRIIFISSIFAKEPDYNFIVSSTIRAGLLGFTKSLATQMAQYGITVNSVLPGYFDTPLLRRIALEKGKSLGKKEKDILARWASELPSKKISQPKTIGFLVSLLASDLVPNLIGAAIPIDEGLAKTLI